VGVWWHGIDLLRLSSDIQTMSHFHTNNFLSSWYDFRLRSADELSTFTYSFFCVYLNQSSFLRLIIYFYSFFYFQGIRVFIGQTDKFSTDQNVLLIQFPFLRTESLLQCTLCPEIVSWANSTTWRAYKCVSNPACVIALLSLSMHLQENNRAHKIFKLLPENESRSTIPSSAEWTTATLFV
jgi:hypothetical protein